MPIESIFLFNMSLFIWEHVISNLTGTTHTFIMFDKKLHRFIINATTDWEPEQIFQKHDLLISYPGYGLDDFVIGHRCSLISKASGTSWRCPNDVCFWGGTWAVFEIYADPVVRDHLLFSRVSNIL